MKDPNATCPECGHRVGSVLLRGTTDTWVYTGHSTEGFILKGLPRYPLDYTVLCTGTEKPLSE